jgi:enoyl-CoA hydratase/carnithine racemase
MPIEVRRENHIAWLRLDGPGRGNALDDADLSAVRRTVVQLGDVPPRVVIVEAAGQDFCAGLHLGTDNPMLDALLPLARRNDRFAVQERLVGWRASLDGIARLPSFVIAAIRGECRGLGFELALCADMRIAHAASSFSLPGATLGLQAWGGGLVRLTRLVGRARATDLAVTGRALDAAAAEQWGIVSRIAEDPAAAAADLAAAVIACPPSALQQSLLAIRSAEELSDRAFNFEAECAARSVCKELEAGLERWRAAKAWKPLG